MPSTIIKSTFHILTHWILTTLPYNVGTVKTLILTEESGTLGGQAACPRLGLVSGWAGICWGQCDSSVHTCNYGILPPLSSQRAGPTAAACMHRRQCLISFMGRAFRYMRTDFLSLSHSSFFWAEHSRVFKCLIDNVDSVLRHLWVSLSLGVWSSLSLKAKNLAMDSLEPWVWVPALRSHYLTLQITSAYNASVSSPEKWVDKSSFFARGQTVLLSKFLSQEEAWHSTSLARETH